MTQKIEYTKGKCEIATETEHGTKTLVLGGDSGVIAECFMSWRKPETCEANAKLICALVNAAQEIGNPLAVAENLKAMYDALKLYQEHQQGTSGHYCWKCAEAINVVLASIEQGGR